MTLSIITLLRRALCKAILIRMTLAVTTLSIMTLCKLALCIAAKRAKGHSA
jgi:hypothetical protein